MNTSLNLSKITGAIFLVTVGLLVILCGNSCNSYIPTVGAQTTYFDAASGIYYPDDEVTSYLRFKNTGGKPWTFWVGYSVWDEMEQFYDVTSHPVTLGVGEESATQSKAWNVPLQPSCITGEYSLAMAVWDKAPEGENAMQLAYQEKLNSFQVFRYFEQFGDFNTGLWKKSNHTMEKSYIDPDNIDINDGCIRLKIPAGTLNGGEISSKNYFKYGAYRTRLKVSCVKGAITGFFLYQDTGEMSDEIDIEIYNDDYGWQIVFTSYVKGAITNTVKKSLMFDPCADFHEYGIDFYPGKVSFFVDGGVLQEFSSGLPQDSMKLLINTWFPEWLQSVPPGKDEYTYIDWIKY